MDRELGSKGIGPMEVLDEAKGEIMAVVSTLGVVDHEREVILPDAFQSGVRIKLSHYGHSSIYAYMKGTGIPVEAPVGKGTITVEGNLAVLHGRFFMSTQRGREAFATAKEMGPEQEWSWTYWIIESEPASEEWRAKGARRVIKTIAPFEASPVTVPGGVGTHTVGVKCEGCGEMDSKSCGCAVKAAEEAAKEAAAREAEAKAAADAEQVLQAEELRRTQDAAVKQAAAEEFERFERTRRRLGVG